MKSYASVFTTTCFLGMITARTASSEDTGAVSSDFAKETSTDKDDSSMTGNRRISATLEDGTVLVVSGTQRIPIELSTPAVAFLQHRDRLYVALGRQGAVVFDISSPDRIPEVRRISGGIEDITGFALIDNEVWMRMVSQKMVPLDAEAKRFPPKNEPSVETAETAETKTKTEIETTTTATPFTHPITILKVENGQATLDIGAAEGAQVGDRFSVFKAVTMKGVAGEDFVGTELAAVVEVIAVNEHRCLTSLWRGDRVTTADTVRPKAKDHRRSMVFPRHLTDLGELSLTLRPILNVDGPIGFGALNSLVASYWGKHYFVAIVLDPLAFAFTNDGNMGLMNGMVEAGFNARAFAIGVGAGIHIARFDSPAFAITQTVRLGAKDGLNVETRNTFLLRKRGEDEFDYDGGNTDDTKSVLGFEWGGLSSQLNIPLGGRLTLFFGGGGSDEYFFGEGGVHAWLLGNGDRGSIGLSAAAGAAGLFASKYNDASNESIDISAVGPMISLGMDWRFGFK